jgi:hypothetical protein
LEKKNRWTFNKITKLFSFFIWRCQNYGTTNLKYWAGPLVGCSNHFSNLGLSIIPVSQSVSLPYEIFLWWKIFLGW